MTAPAKTNFVNGLRSRPGTIELAPAGTHAITVRVEIPEVWDVVRLRVSPGATVREVKREAIAALQPDAQHVEDYIAKLRGWEVLNEDATLTEAGLVDGSILLVHYRRKRPVR